MSFLALDAQALYTELQRGVQSLCTASTQLVGVHSGGAWLAERLQCDLQRAGSHGTISSVMHRDDYARRGLSAGGQTQLPFDVNGADILVLDDVLYTGRPARVRLAVLVDRGGRELPVQADFAAARVVLPATQSLALARSDAGVFSFQVEESN